MRAWKLERALILIEKEGRTRKWLAEYVGITQLSLNHYLSGRRIPGRPIIKLIAQALNTTEGYLLGESAKNHTTMEVNATVG